MSVLTAPSAVLHEAAPEPAAVAVARMECRAAVKRLHDRTVSESAVADGPPLPDEFDTLLERVLEARARLLSAAHPVPEDVADSGRPLTHRQLEILRLVADGVSTIQIASRLYLSRATVRNHVAAALRALEAHSRLEAVAIARRRSLI